MLEFSTLMLVCCMHVRLRVVVTFVLGDMTTIIDNFITIVTNIFMTTSAVLNGLLLILAKVSIADFFKRKNLDTIMILSVEQTLKHFDLVYC